MARPPFPKTLREFQSKFAAEEACQQYLAACRWPDGFVCPKCGNRRACELANLQRWECAGCRYQGSLTAGTILHNTKTPLTVWFWAAYLMTTDKRGLSALLLQRQLGLGSYCFDPLKRSPRRMERPETRTRCDPPLHESMVLLDDVVQVPYRSATTAST